MKQEERLRLLVEMLYAINHPLEPSIYYSFRSRFFNRLRTREEKEIIRNMIEHLFFTGMKKYQTPLPGKARDDLSPDESNANGAIHYQQMYMYALSTYPSLPRNELTINECMISFIPPWPRKLEREEDLDRNFKSEGELNLLAYICADICVRDVYRIICDGIIGKTSCLFGQLGLLQTKKMLDFIAVESYLLGQLSADPEIYLTKDYYSPANSKEIQELLISVPHEREYDILSILDSKLDALIRDYRLPPKIRVAAAMFAQHNSYIKDEARLSLTDDPVICGDKTLNKILDQIKHQAH